MKPEDIKKALYKEKPLAEKRVINDGNGNVIYSCETSLGEVIFCIPTEEAKDFGNREPAQLLIRWISYCSEKI